MIYEMQTNAPLIHEKFQFGDSESDHFETEGYYIFEHCLTDEALEEGRSHIDRMLDQRVDDFPGTEMMSPHQLGEKWMWDIMTDPKILDFVERRLGQNLVLWHADLLCKEPEIGREILWHQDQAYWDAQQVRAPLAILWVPFDDVDEANGTMSVLPGEHVNGMLPGLSIEGDFFGLAVSPEALPQDSEEREVIYRLRAGQEGTHSSYVPHRSRPNLSNAWRRVMTMHFMRADAKEMGERHYTSYLDQQKFDREYYLVRGEDVNNRGLKRSPFE